MWRGLSSNFENEVVKINDIKELWKYSLIALKKGGEGEGSLIK